VFAGRTTDLRVELGAGGRRQLTETVRSSTTKPAVFEGVDPFSPTPAQAAEYAGVYHSQEIEPAYRIEFADGKAVLRRLKSAPVTLEPLTRDVFRGSAGTLRFSRDPRGRVSGFTLSSGRIRGFRFSRDAAGPE
jgi:hypothetical protein